MTRDIQELFDKQFYNQYYGCNSNVDIFLKEENDQGRYIHPCIIEDNFDYGLFVSKLRWETEHFIPNEFAAIDYYLDNRDKYKSWFEQAKTQNKNRNIENICCIYVAYLNSESDCDIARESLHQITKDIDNVYVVLLGNSKYFNFFEKYNVVKFNNLFSLRHVLKYENYIYINNNIMIYKSIADVIQSFANSEYGLYSLNDKYNIPYSKRYHYGLNSNFLLFGSSISIPIIKMLLRLQHDIDFNITKYALDNNIPYGFYFQNITEKEKFWFSLFDFDILDYRTLTNKHRIPAISKTCLSRDLSNTSECFISSDVMSQSNPTVLGRWYSSCDNNVLDIQEKIACHIHIGNTNSMFVDYIKKYMKILNTKFNIDFYVTSNNEIKELDTMVLENKGADIGPFLYCLNNILKENKHQYILKLHTKTTHGFRDMCFETLVNNLKEIIYLLNHKNRCYIAGTQSKNMMLDDRNEETIRDICKRYDMDYDKQYIDFFTGTMFVCKVNMFKEIMDKYNINWINEYWLLENGYKKNHRATFTHAWERMLSGVLPYLLKSTKIYM